MPGMLSTLWLMGLWDADCFVNYMLWVGSQVMVLVIGIDAIRKSKDCKEDPEACYIA